MPRILPLLPAIPRLKIVDVGAMWINEDSPAYSRLLQAVPCEVIGFEPLAAEREKLKQLRPGHTWLPHLIGDGSHQTFYECNRPFTSSLLRPNTTLLDKFQNLEMHLRVVKETPVETARLDDIPETADADLLKLDIQGGELMALKGAVERLKSVLAVYTEVEFLPMYENQPLFAEIDQFLRAQGFSFFKFTTLHGRAFKPLMRHDGDNETLGQLLWTNAIYLRDFMSFDALAPEALLKLAVIAHVNYGAYDLAGIALEAYGKQTGTDLHERYIGQFKNPKS